MSEWRDKLEGELAGLAGARGAISVGYGRAALWLALETAEVRGGEVLVPELVCAQVTEAVRGAGARPVFYPVGRDASVGAGEFEAAITRETRAAIVVHYWGRVQPGVAKLAEICRRRGVFCIEDCALALGAALGGRPPRRAGSFGAAGVFSFTKSDWCYGGGAVTSDAETFLARARAISTQSLRRDARRAWYYGLLRRVDFAANRPRWCALAEFAGRRLQQLCFPGASDFYAQGRTDAAMPDFAARRALRILRGLDEVSARRREIVRRLYGELDARREIFLWPPPGEEETAAFVPFIVPSKNAAQWVEAADKNGVTLRLTWPAYQEAEAGQRSDELRWWAERVVLLEVHPELSKSEVARMVTMLRR